MKAESIIKWIAILIGIGILSFIGFWFYTLAFFSNAFETDYSAKDLIENYQTKTNEIYLVKEYINSITPSDKTVEIEFENNNTIAIFHVTDKSGIDNNWNIKTNSLKTEALIEKLGWTSETLSTIKDKLDNANCISIKSGDPSNIGFQRSGMGMYSYNIFNKPIVDSLKVNYNDSCTYILYNENVILEYGGGAIGPQCFEDLPNKK